MRNVEAASVISELADIMALLWEDQYRVARHRDAAPHIEHHAEPIGDLAREWRLEEIYGVGKSIGA
jgi:DNA polymerase/3'-5' exonuclease PolX